MLSEPTLECALQVLDQGERRLVDALGSLLQAYSQYIAPLQKDATDLISNTCASLQEQHGDPVLIDRLADAVYAWMATARPLLLLSTYHGGRNLNFDTPVTELRKLNRQSRGATAGIMRLRAKLPISPTISSAPCPPPLISWLRTPSSSRRCRNMLASRG